jgi:hypothetical protein
MHRRPGLPVAYPSLNGHSRWLNRPGVSGLTGAIHSLSLTRKLHRESNPAPATK